MATNLPQPGARNKNLLTVGVLLIVLAGAAVYLFLAPRLKTARQDLAVSAAKLKDLQTDVATLTTSKQQLEQDKAAMTAQRGVDFTKIALVYPHTEDVPGLYLQLEALMNQGTQNGLTGAPSYQVGAPAQDPTTLAVQIPISITAVGPYSALVKFITSLEQNLRPLSIQTLNLAQTVGPDGSNSGDLFTLNLAAIVRAETLSSSYTATTTTTP